MGHWALVNNVDLTLTDMLYVIWSAPEDWNEHYDCLGSDILNAVIRVAEDVIKFGMHGHILCWASWFEKWYHSSENNVKMNHSRELMMMI